MIELNFKKQYLSIKEFQNTSLNDFSLLTGLNGVGKTHLLKAIDLGHIEVKGINHQDIIYANYNDFTVKPQPNDKKENQPRRQNSLFDAYNKKISGIKNLFDNYTAPLDFSIYSMIIKHYPIEVEEILMNEEQEIGMYGHINNTNNTFEQTIGTEKDFTHLTNFHDLQEIESNKHLFTRQFYFFIHILFGHNGNFEEININLVRNRYKDIILDLENRLLNIDSDLFQFIKSNSRFSKNIFCLTSLDFEQFNLLATEIAEEIKRYIILRLKNDFNEISSTKWDKKLPYLSREEFIEVNGNNPIEILNQVLSEYDCNGYYFKEAESNINIEQNFNDINIPIQLINKAEGFITNLSNLSSGEQTLLTLALMLYKAKQGKVFPRLLLLDEIDSALHPTMIKRLLQVIDSVFVKERNLKVIMVTHSPTTVAVNDNEEIYVLERAPHHIITLKPKKEAIEFLTDGFATLETGMKLFDQISKKRISIITEGNNVSYLAKANDYFGSSDIEIISGLKSFTGKNQLETLFHFFSMTSHNNKVVFVWDCDVNSKLTASNNTYPFIFKQNMNNSKVIKGIENLFDEALFTEDYYLTKSKEDGGFHSSLNKSKFEKDMIRIGSQSDFKNFKPLFEMLMKL